MGVVREVRRSQLLLVRSAHRITRTHRLARDRPRFPSTPAPVSATTPVSASPLAPVPDPLETVKFVCKDVWIALYDKQVDNLRTNHRGVYVLHDNAFRPLLKLSGARDDKEVARMVQFVSCALLCTASRPFLTDLGDGSSLLSRQASSEGLWQI